MTPMGKEIYTLKRNNRNKNVDFTYDFRSRAKNKVMAGFGKEW